MHILRGCFCLPLQSASQREHQPYYPAFLSYALPYFGYAVMASCRLVLIFTSQAMKNFMAIDLPCLALSYKFAAL